ncbi:MAG TPA: NnrS family protein [Burkholderiales bacterium]|nr:NnrS family protein [Burkholderiales bacterium]
MTLFAYGFRPFFLAAGLCAVLVVPGWILMFAHGSMPLGDLPPPLWHAHELFYGFVGAALAGFLLTAVPSWTGAKGFGGGPLAAVASAWLLGRLAFAFANALPFWALAAAELAFLPGVALLLAPPLVRSRNRNTALLLVLALLWITDATFLAGLARRDPGLASGGLRIAIDLMLVVVTLIGGRIVPSFTANALRRRGEGPEIRSLPWLERTVMALMIAVVVVDLWRPEGAIAGGLAALVALAQALRLSGWRSLRTRGEAILWVLHLGYAWLPFGFALKALSLLAGAGWAAHWLHALTMGAFGTMILAVMTRAALGHTGRDLTVGRGIAAAYVLLTLGVVTRVFAPALWPSHYLWTVIASGLLWTAAFAVYLVVYTPILVLPRADGKPG